METTKHTPTPSFRCYVKEYRGNNKAVFGCFKAGHEFVSSVITPKQWRLCRKDDFVARFHANWWSKERGGVHMECPKCKKENAR